ncbi:MAG: hypothetical protein IJH75_03060 [Mogibacterium sp.]|nr:hypothetical protein [Mogibacterium sp.]
MNNYQKKILTIRLCGGEVQASLYEGSHPVRDLEPVAFGEGAAAAISAQAGEVDCVVCPGGVLKPLKRGLYAIDQNVLDDSASGVYGKHPYNQLAKIAADIAAEKVVPAYMLLPMSTDELLTRNRISSNSNVPKKSRYYALEQAAAIDAVTAPEDIIAEDHNYIVAYIDDMTCVGAYLRGFCIDVNDMIGQEGPMGFTSSGDVPNAQLSSYVMKTGIEIQKLIRTLKQESGIKAYTGTDVPAELDALTDEDAKLAVRALVYQVSKWIGSSALVLKGTVDGIILAGKGAQSKVITEGIRERVGGIAEVTVVPELDTAAYMAKCASVAGSFIWPVQKY